MIKEGILVISILMAIMLSSAVLASGTILVSQDPVSLLIAAGNHYAKQQDYEKAQFAFFRAIEFENSAAAYHNLGVISYEQGEIESAVDYFKQAIEADPKYFKAEYSLGLLYFHQDEFDASVEHLSKASLLEPNNAHVHFDLGVAYVERFRQKETQGILVTEDVRDLKKGLEHYQLTIAIDPFFAHAQKNAQIVQRVLNEYTSLE